MILKCYCVIITVTGDFNKLYAFQTKEISNWQAILSQKPSLQKTIDFTLTQPGAFNSLSARGEFFRLLIIFANSFDPDQARQNFGPDLGPRMFDTLIVFLKEFLEKNNFEENLEDVKYIMKNYPAWKELSRLMCLYLQFKNNLLMNL